METQAKTMMESATTKNDGSQSRLIEEFAALLMLWHMRLSMLAYQMYLKNLWNQQLALSKLQLIYFPNQMEKPPWLEDDEDEDEEYYD